MAYAWRGTALIIEPSHTHTKWVRLRHPLSREIVTATQNSRKAAIRYCQQNGYSWMEPVKDVDQSRREMRVF